MERAGRRLGLPLETLELLGQDPGVCAAFTRAATLGEAGNFLAAVDWAALAAEREQWARAALLPPAI